MFHCNFILELNPGKPAIRQHGSISPFWVDVELYLVYLNIKGTVVKLSKGMTDVSKKGNIANCLEPSDNELCVHAVLCLLCVETTALL